MVENISQHKTCDIIAETTGLEGNLRMENKKQGERTELTSPAHTGEVNNPNPTATKLYNSIDLLLSLYKPFSIKAGYSARRGIRSISLLLPAF